MMTPPRPAPTVIALAPRITLGARMARLPQTSRSQYSRFRRDGIFLNSTVSPSDFFSATRFRWRTAWTSFGSPALGVLDGIGTERVTGPANLARSWTVTGGRDREDGRSSRLNSRSLKP